MQLKLLLFFIGWMTAGYVSPDASESDSFTEAERQLF